MFSIKSIRDFADELKINNSVVIVEGKNDKKVFSKLGLSNIFEISGKSYENLLELLLHHKFKFITVLTDFDFEGEKKASRLVQLLVYHGFKINFSARKKLKSISKITKIEELLSLTKLLEDDYYGKTCSIYDKILNRSRVYHRRNGGKTRCHRGDIWAN